MFQNYRQKGEAGNVFVMNRQFIAGFLMLVIVSIVLIQNIFDVTDTITFQTLLFNIACPAVIFIIIIFFHGRLDLAVSGLDRAVFVFGIYIIIRYLIQENFYILNDRFLFVICVIFYYFIFRLIKPDSRIIRAVLSLIYIITVILGCLSKLNFLNEIDFLRHNNSGLLSIYYASFIPYIMHNIFMKQYKKPIIIWMFVFVIAGIVLIILLKSRTSWIALLAGLLVLVFFRKVSSIHIKEICLITLSFLVFIVLFIIMLYQYKKDSSDGRLFIYHNTIEMIKVKPLFGFGFDTYKSEYLKYQEAYFETHPDDTRNAYLADNTRNAFNDYLCIWAECGILGFLGAFLIVFFILKSVNKNNLPFFSSIVVILVSALFSYPLSVPYILLNLIVFTAELENLAENSENAKYEMQVPKILKGIFVFLLSMILVLSTINMSLYNKWNQAYLRVRVLDMSGFNKYGKIYNFMSGNGGYLFNYGSELIVAGNYELGIKILESSKFYFNDNFLHLYLGNAYCAIGAYDKAESCYFQSINMVPNRFYPKYKLLLMYESTGQIFKMRNLAEQILSMEIKVPSKMVDEIRNYARGVL